VLPLRPLLAGVPVPAVPTVPVVGVPAVGAAGFGVVGEDVGEAGVVGDAGFVGGGVVGDAGFAGDGVALGGVLGVLDAGVPVALVGVDGDIGVAAGDPAAAAGSSVP